MSFYLLEGAVNNGTQWQQWTYPRRGAKLSGTVIMHTSESVLDIIGDDSGAEDCAAFIGRRTGSYGSYHDLVDSDSIVELVPFEYEAWQDSETNNWAVGISAACRTTDWATMGEAKREGFYRNLAWCAADFVIYMREAYGIEVPRRRISGEEARNRVPGFCAHGDSGLYRTDPGKDFDWARFFRYIEDALNGNAPTPNKIVRNSKMLIIGTQKGGDGSVWIGDGVVRTHVPNPRALQDLQWFATNGFLNIKENGKVLEFEAIDGLGADIVARTANEVLFKPLPWFNQDGVNPTEGRSTITLSDTASWYDYNLGVVNKNVAAVKAVVDSFEVGKVELTPSDLQGIADELKKVLAPGLAADLAKRLAE